MDKKEKSDIKEGIIKGCIIPAIALMGFGAFAYLLNLASPYFGETSILISFHTFLELDIALGIGLWFIPTFTLLCLMLLADFLHQHKCWDFRRVI